VIKQIIVETPISILSINADGIGLMHFKDGATMDVPEQMEHFKGIVELTKNYPTPFVVTAGEYVVITKEAKENSSILESQSPVCAMAIVVSNLAYRLLADFFAIRSLCKPAQVIMYVPLNFPLGVITSV